MNEVTNFMYWCYNKLNEQELIAVFGQNLGKHLFQKWAAFKCDSLRWYADLDRASKQKVVDRANHFYGK